jgi:hypothetical protein
MEATETNVVYEGETKFGLIVEFGQNCSNWSVEMFNHLFTNPLWGVTNREIIAGEGRGFGLDINPDAELGPYPVTIFVNYTNEDNEPIINRFYLTLYYNRSIEIIDLHLPTSDDLTFSVSVETFQRIDNLTVRFDGDGDVGVADEEMSLFDVPVGKQFFSTTVHRRPEGMSGQEVGYSVIAQIGERTVEFGEYNIDVTINWDGRSDDDSPSNRMRIILIIVSLGSILVAINYYLFFYKQEK